MNAIHLDRVPAAQRRQRIPGRRDRVLALACSPGEPGSAPVESRAALDAALAGWPNADVQDRAEFEAGITGQIDQRAIGMHRRQLRRVARTESMLIAALGTALGGMPAVGAAWAVVSSLGDQGVTELAMPAGQLAVIGAMPGVAGVLAATGSARRGARGDVLTALASE